MTHIQIYESWRDKPFEWLEGSMEVGLHILRRVGTPELWVLNEDLLNDHYPELWEKYLTYNRNTGEYYPSDDSSCEKVARDVYSGDLPHNLKGRELVFQGNSAQEFKTQFEEKILLKIPNAEAADWLTDQLLYSRRSQKDAPTVKDICSLLFRAFPQD